MALDPGLALQVAQAAQPQDALAQYGKALALKNALQQNQIGAQQLQEGQIGLQQKQLLFDDQQKISKVLSDPSVNGDIEKAIPMLGPAGVSGQSILSITKGLDEHREKIANVTKAQADAAQANQKVEGEQKGLVDDMLQGLANNPSATAADLLSRAHILTTTSPALAPKIAPIIAQIQQAPDPDAAARQIVQSAATASSQARAAEAAKNAAAGKKDTAEAARTEFQNTLMQTALAGGAGAGEGVIQQRFAGNPAAAQKAIAAWRQNLSTGDLKTANEEVNKIYEQEIGSASKITAETPAKVAQERQMIPVAAARAGAEENARIPGRVAGAVQEQQALAKTSPDAFAGITNPASRNSAQNEADRVYKDYSDKVGQTQSFLDSVNAARTNPAIAATIPMQEVRSFVNRVNATELKSVSSGVGGILDRADTWLQKNATGIPPKWLLDDVAQIGDIQNKAAKRGFDAGKQRLQMRGVDVTKLPAPDTGAPAAAPAGGGWKVIKVE